METLIAWLPSPLEIGTALILVLLVGGIAAVVTSRKK
jgi:ABC-type antimicrobial peptide transport system permease subunit